MRVLQYLIKPNHTDYLMAKQQAEQSKLLYNQVNFFARMKYFKLCNKPDLDTSTILDYNLQDWFTNDDYLGSPYVFESIRKKIQIKNNILLKAKLAQRILTKLATDWKSYFKLKSTSGYERSARIPHYKNKYNLVEYTIQTISKPKLRNHIICPTDWQEGVLLPTDFKGIIKSARLIHSHADTFVLEVIYEEETLPKIQGDTVASIDLGVDSLVTLTFDRLKKPICYKSPKLKSYNQWYNKEKARLQRLLPKNQYISNRIQYLTNKRNRRINHILHGVSNAIVSDLCHAHVRTLVIGWNTGFKKNSTMGTVNNQKFVQIPFRNLINKLKYKCEAVGIEVIEQEESYTSKSSFLDNDIIPIYEAGVEHRIRFSGRRISRGRYITGNGLSIHADVNGSYNILRKSNQSQNISNLNTRILGKWLSRGSVVEPIGKYYS